MAASICLSASTSVSQAKVSFCPPPFSSSSTSSSPSTSASTLSRSTSFFRCSLLPSPCPRRRLSGFTRIWVGGRRSHVVRMAPEEQKITRRSPLDFPIEWDRPKPGKRPDIFPQFSPMKTPLPPPMPYDPPEEDEEDEENKEEEEENPDKEDGDKLE